MNKLKKIAQVVRSIERIKKYLVGDEYLVIIKRRKKAIVRLEGKVIFNNMKNDDSFRKWKRSFNREHRGVKRKKLKKERIQEIESVYIGNKENVQVRRVREALLKNIKHKEEPIN